MIAIVNKMSIFVYNRKHYEKQDHSTNAFNK